MSYLEFKTKKELLFLLQDENFSLLKDEILKTDGAIIYYFGLYDLENKFLSKEFDEEIQKILTKKTLMDNNMSSKYIKMLEFGMIKDSNTGEPLKNLSINGSLSFSMDSLDNSNENTLLTYWGNFQKVLNSNIKINVESSFFKNYLNSYSAVLNKEMTTKWQEVKKILDDIKLPLIHALNNNEIISLSLKNILLKHFENRQPQTENDFMVAGVSLLSDGQLADNIEYYENAFYKENNSYLDYDYNNLLSDKLLKDLINGKKNGDLTIADIVKGYESLVDEPEIWNSNDFKKGYVQNLLLKKNFNKIKNLLKNEKIKSKVIYALWMVEDEKEISLEIDEVLKDVSVDEVLTALFDDEKVKISSDKIVSFYNISLKNNSPFWNKVFLSEKFLKKITKDGHEHLKVNEIIRKNNGVQNFIEKYIDEKIDNKKLSLSDLVLASKFIISIDENWQQTVSTQLLKVFKKAQDEIFSDDIEYLNFVVSDDVFKKVVRHINELPEDDKMLVKDLKCFNSDYELWNEDNSKMEFFQRFHDMYLTGVLNGIQDIPENRKTELIEWTKKKPSVYLTSCVHKGHKMFVNESREEDIISAWLEGALKSKDVNNVNSLFNKFMAAVNLFKNPVDKTNFINSVNISINKFLDNADFLQTHPFFTMEEYQKEVNKNYDAFIDVKNFKPRELPNFVIKYLFEKVLKSENEEHVNSFIKNLVLGSNFSIIKTYLDKNEYARQEMLKNVLSSLEDCFSFNIFNDSEKIIKNIFDEGYIKIKEGDTLLSCLNALTDSGVFRMIKDGELDEDKLKLVIPKNVLIEAKNRIYELIYKGKQSEIKYSEDEKQFLKELKEINDKYPEVIMYIIPELDVNILDMKYENREFLEDMKNIKLALNLFNVRCSIDKYSESEKETLYKMIESDIFAEAVSNIYKINKSKCSLNETKGLLDNIINYLIEKDSFDNIYKENFMDYIRNYNNDFIKCVLDKDLDLKKLMKIVDFIKNDDITLTSKLLDTFIDLNMDRLEQNDVLTLININNQHITDCQMKNMEGKRNSLGNMNLFNIDLIEPLFNKIQMKVDLECEREKSATPEIIKPRTKKF